MSSATSINTPSPSAAPDDHGLRPWQFFLLAGMLSATGVVLVATGQSPASIVVLSLTVVAASFVALGAYRFLLPLVVAEAVVAPSLIVGRTRAALEREKTLVLRSIKELEFDHAMGKISKSDFEEMSGRLRARAIGLIRQLDAGGGYRETIEYEVAGRIAGRAVVRPASAEAGAVASSATSGVTSQPVTVTAVTLPANDVAEAADPAICECGTANDFDARFCKTCGSKLKGAA